MKSGKFVLRIDPQLHQDLLDQARLEGDSLNSVCIKKLTTQNLHSSMLADEIIYKINSHFKTEAVVLFGSQVRGQATSTSDIDLLIVLNNSLRIDRQLYADWDKHFAKLKANYSPQFVHLPNSLDKIGSLWLEASIDAEILYDPNNKIKKVFSKIRCLIAEGKYLRKISHGHGYWIRQEQNAK